MLNRFNSLNIYCQFYSGASQFDNRVMNKNFNKHYMRQILMTLSHLDIINEFYTKTDSSIKYAIICEDDILLHQDFASIITNVIDDFQIMDLDVLLLGYMLPYKITDELKYKLYKPKKLVSSSELSYLDYPEFLGGTQMYMITKAFARYLLHTYYNKPMLFYDKKFIPDKVLIKSGNKALLYPMIAMENGNQTDLYHKHCYTTHFEHHFI
jgi:GR25 family glycosyltransferase involved in LPS biosynthesis